MINIKVTRKRDTGLWWGVIIALRVSDAEYRTLIWLTQL
jgi:hypothetical protein